LYPRWKQNRGIFFTVHHEPQLERSTVEMIFFSTIILVATKATMNKKPGKLIKLITSKDVRTAVWCTDSTDSTIKVVQINALWLKSYSQVDYNTLITQGMSGCQFYSLDVKDAAAEAYIFLGGTERKIPHFVVYFDDLNLHWLYNRDIEKLKKTITQLKVQTGKENTGSCPPAFEKIIEPLLQESADRFVLFPIQNSPVWEMYKKHESTFWTAEELDLSTDKDDFDHKLTENERFFVKHILAFFAASDAIVNENLVQNFMDEVQCAEARCFYGFQVMIESIHTETYSLLIDTLITDKKEKHDLFNAIKTVPIIKRKAEWCFRWMDRTKASFAERLVAFAIVEGIFFSGSFCAIFWLKKRNILNGVCLSNEFISRDEGLHCDFACLLYSQLNKKLSQQKIYDIMDSAVDMECEFVTTALPVNLIGMNSQLMCQYIRFCADRLIYALGCEKKYKVANPFEWMTMISLQGKSNFFEKVPSEYAKAGVGVTDDEGFTLDADF
jgi:ribonucleotide reductase beta subunit family protein with ferritin-like domain